jgi:hypothetical protein
VRCHASPARQNAELRQYGNADRNGRSVMGDVLYLGLALGFFALSWAFIALCGRL